ncbi:MAG: hypothetical protein ACREXY_27955, partial [Gammaproteobacteria bacterium]
MIEVVHRIDLPVPASIDQPLFRALAAFFALPLMSNAIVSSELVNQSTAHPDRCVACSLLAYLPDMSRRSLRGSLRSGLLDTNETRRR